MDRLNLSLSYVRIKFCGLRREEEVRLAIELGIDAIGFVLTPSPRQVTPEHCRLLRSQVPSWIQTHAVFGPIAPEEIRSLFRATGVDIAQVHGPDDPSYWEALRGIPRIRAFRVHGPETLALIASSGEEIFLLDAFLPDVPGGTGARFDWNLAREARKWGRVILAGGLTPQNVVEAIRMAQPYMVDVSSGIESSPGMKDPEAMCAFVRAVRQEDKPIPTSPR